MGIQGLLPLLKSIMVPIHIKELEGSCVAIDTYSWLHKGALSCSKDLCKGLPTSRHIDYCMHRVNLLRHYGVKPMLVFDGGLLPMKIEQENKRARGRKENLARAMEHESNGNSSAAYECYQKAVDISPSIAHELIQVLKQENISYVVAPYEADAQMTFLAVSKQVDAVITEDSDLIPFGCPRIIFKMDKFGQAVQFQHSMLQQNKDLSFAGFTKQMILEMCILSGCDYLQSLPGMGLKRAHALIKRFTTYDQVIKHLRYSISSVPPLYEESFKKALLTFQHQRVYDTITEKIVHLSDISENLEDDGDFLGPMIPQDIAKGIAEGDLDPFTKMPFQGTASANTTFKLKNFDLGSVKKKLDLPVQKNLLTQYFCFASVEAKRKFRAPRFSPNQSSPTCNSSPNSNEHVSEGDDFSEKSCSDTPSPLHSDNVGNLSLPGAPVDNGVAPEVQELLESPKHDMANKTSPEYTSLQKPKHSIHKPCLAQQKEHDFGSVPDAIEGKVRKENRKVIVRSSYFQHKSEDENDLENKQNTLIEDNPAAYVVSESAVANGYSNTANLLKRREHTSESVQEENVNSKKMCIATDEGKFGSNISHLAKYSDIAEKSMEKFVSIISSFKFSSSGSRASGLRAPLKDARNTSTNRSTVGVDLNQFAYVPKKHKS
ncbi:exonuclease 1 isoform X1 [Humulus lupulus]|uniref:exonuclease 1 isoform X1 n=1 Tax=Humulus lupulus TaxID=3486 RepID=UPI002B40580B|nr:exonuclease 1 isoform X1 [Humulus lupulus]